MCCPGGRFSVIGVALLLPFILDAQSKSPTGAIEGVVKDAKTDAALGGGDVLLYPSGMKEAPLLVTADQTGHFAVDDIDPGRYRVVAQHTGYISRAYGARRRNRQGILVPVARGQHVEGIEIRLELAGVITGHVLGDNNEPRVGTTVMALTPQYLHGEAQLSVGAVAITNDLGEYRLYGLRPDRYFMAAFEPNRHDGVRLPKGAPPEELYGISFYPNSMDATKAMTITVQPGSELNGADIYLSRHKTFDVRGRLIGAERGMAHDAHVQLLPLLAGSGVDVGLRDTAPDERGIFEFNEVLPGSYVLSGSYVVNRQTYRVWQPLEIEQGDLTNVILSPSPGIELQGKVQVSGQTDVDLRGLTFDFYPKFSRAYGTPNARVGVSGTFAAFLNADRYYLEVPPLREDWYVESIRVLEQDASDRLFDFTGYGGLSARMDIAINTKGAGVERNCAE